MSKQMTQSFDELLELAAVSAETWQDHGDLECIYNWCNRDGFP